METTKTKRLASWVLSVTLVLALLPMTAMAAMVTEITNNGWTLTFPGQVDDTVYSFTADAITDLSAISTDYPSITKGYELALTGFEASEIAYVNLPAGDQSSSIHVYNETLTEYLGTGADNIRFEEVYYLSSKLLTDVITCPDTGLEIYFETLVDDDVASVTAEAISDLTAIQEDYPTITKGYELTITGFDEADVDYVALPAGDADAWVYDDNFVNGGHVGRGDDSLPFRDIYYLSDSQLVVDTPVINNPSNNNDDDDDSDNDRYSNDDDDDDDDDDNDDYRYGGGASGGSNVSRTDSTPTPVTSTTATTSVTNAIQTAQENGTDRATARLTNPGEITLDVLQGMASQAGGTELRVNADSIVGNEVDVRISLDPSQANSDLDLSASTVNDTAVSVENQFERFFTNEVMAVSLGQSGSFGMPVQIAAKIADGLNTTNLVFYHYDAATNRYSRITVPAYWIDENG